MNVLFFLVALTLDVVVTIVGGWMISYLWQWFIVPTFELPSISVVQAIGLALVISFMTKRTPNPVNYIDIRAVFDAGVNTIIYMFTMFGFGFGFSIFM